jgi:dipeptidase
VCSNGWWDPKSGPLDFWQAFAYHPDASSSNQYTDRRIWRVYSLLQPSQQWDPNAAYYPFGIVPDAKIGVPDVLALLRDYYQGTDFDLTNGIAAGPFGNPYRYDTGGETNLTGQFERAISIDRGLFSFVAMARPFLPDHIGAAIWYGWDWPGNTAYHPLWVSSATVPAEYDVCEGSQSKFSLKSPWRPFNLVNNWALLRFDKISLDIRAKAEQWEQKAYAMVADVEKRAQKLDVAAASKLLETSQNTHANALVADW